MIYLLLNIFFNAAFTSVYKQSGTHSEGVSQTEGCILQRLNFSAATSSNVAEDHLNLKDSDPDNLDELDQVSSLS